MCFVQRRDSVGLVGQNISRGTGEEQQTRKIARRKRQQLQPKPFSGTSCYETGLRIGMFLFSRMRTTLSIPSRNAIDGFGSHVYILVVSQSRPRGRLR